MHGHRVGRHLAKYLSKALSLTCLTFQLYMAWSDPGDQGECCLIATSSRASRIRASGRMKITPGYSVASGVPRFGRGVTSSAGRGSLDMRGLVVSAFRAAARRSTQSLRMARVRLGSPSLW